MNKKSKQAKLKKLLKRREAIISRIKKDELKFEEVLRLMEVARQQNQDKLNTLTQEILGCIDENEVQAFVNRFAEDLISENDNVAENQSETDEDENVTDNQSEIDEDKNVTENQSEIDEDKNVTENQIPVDDYAESFRKQYGL